MEIEMHEVVSSQISAIGYDAPSKTLAIEFKGKDGKPGSLYHYDGCDADTFEALRSAESVGSYFYKHIKPNADKYPYRKIAARRPENSEPC